MDKDYYSILGVTRNATKSEIKAAYRKLALKYHPDKNPDDPFFDKMFKDLKDAYETLYYDNNRKVYDKRNGQSQQENYNNHKNQRKTNDPAPEEVVQNIIYNLKEMIAQTKGAKTKQIDTKIITNYLSKILDDKLLPIYSYIDYQQKKDLIYSIITLLRFLNEAKRNLYITQIVRIAEYNNDLIQQIAKKVEIEVKSQKKKDKDSFLYEYWRVILFFISGVIIAVSTMDNEINDDVYKPVQARDIVVDEEPEAKIIVPSKWKNNQLKTGDSPYNQYFGKGIYDKNYQNRLTIHNGQGTDVIVCLTEYRVSASK